ncbi:MAG: radical SAM protein [Asgard group archaeon]|nr:radical SAM protein [Asgard group archaeon]
MTTNYHYLFGPVPSRRLGRSLGVSPIPPKTCNYSCVYCQIGRTTHFTNIREDFFPKEVVLQEINSFLLSNEDFDYITFVGEGEPTLCKSLGWLISETKKLTTKPIAVITNGALLYDEQLRKELVQADVILPTLDATTQTLFKKINRPIKGLEIHKIIEGMKAFRREYKGKIWMEVMLVEGLNDDPETIAKIKHTLEEIHCDRIYVNVPIRPPAEKWVKIPSKDRILQICSELQAYNIAHYEASEGFHIEQETDLEQQILNITTRHPLREEQIIAMLDLPQDKILNLLETMAKKGKIKKVIHYDQIFWIKKKN